MNKQNKIAPGAGTPKAKKEKMYLLKVYHAEPKKSSV